MSVKSISNTTSKDLVEAAVRVFEKTSYLEFRANRQRSTLYVPVCTDRPLMIDARLRKACLNRVTPKVAHVGTHYFSNLDGNTYYVNLEEIEAFTKHIKGKYKDLTTTRLFALVDADTGIELMPAEIVPNGWETPKDESYSIDIKIRAFVAHLLKTDKGKQGFLQPPSRINE